ncbi:MAG: hypothetical protein AB8B91_14480 [Rubripirellula sp.]
MAKRVDLRWLAAPNLSAAHATYVIATGAPCTDEKTVQLLVGSVTDINNRLVTASIEMGTFWNEYFSGVLADCEMSVACSQALLAAGCSEMQVEQTTLSITRRLRDAEQAFQKKFPKLNDQLDLRARPLRDRWGTVGPGLLREVERQIWDSSPPKNWWVSGVKTLMVQPIRGGDGGFSLDHSTLWMEAMLTDADPAVPEVLRIIWLLTRMAIDQHTSGKADEQNLGLPWSLASVPIVLTAGVELELIRGELPIRRAMELWQFGDAALSNVLQRWWNAHVADPTPLPVALKLLQKEIQADQDSADQRSVSELL